VRCINVKLLYEEDFTFESGILAMWTTAELAVTIIAASIPVLRILVRNMVTNRSYSQSGGNGDFTAGTHTSVVASSRRGLKNSVSSSGDADSVRSLNLPRQDSGHIVKFETVTVDYDRRSGQSDNLDAYAFEMANVSPKRQNSARKF
jgi:hypothetical protein